MKKQLIFGSMLALGSMAYAQNEWAGPGSNNTTGSIYRTGFVGLGNTAPAFPLDITTAAVDGGMRVTQTSNFSGAAHLYLNNTGTGGRNWSMLSTGPANNVGAGHFTIYDITSNDPRFFISGGSGSTAGNVGIGTTSPGAQLHAVSSQFGGMGVKGEATNSGSGVYGSGNFGVDGFGVTVGTRGFSYGSGNVGQKTGVRGGAGFGAVNIGGYFEASGSPSGVTSYGVYAEITNPGLGGTNYGVYSTVGGSPNNGGAGPNFAGFFNGDVVTSQGSYLFSDRRLKKDVAKLDNSLDIISRLNPVSYKFDTEGNPDLALSAEKQYGFISQEIREVLPELTKVVINPARLDKDGKEIYSAKEILSLNYNGFISLLTKGIQEQQQQIENEKRANEELRAQMADLKKQVAELSSGKTTGINGSNAAIDGFALDQNIPNPFSSETVIGYSLPQQVNSASMLIYDLSGKQIASFPIEKTSTSLTITSEKLSAGIYIYSVMADGKILDSKRMVVASK